MELVYIEDNCFRWTFKAKKVKKFVEEQCRGPTLNLFAGKIRLDIDELRVDILDDYDPDICMDAEDFISRAKHPYANYDTIIYDPPWNERKSKELFNGKYIGKFTKMKDDIVALLNPNGQIISLGYTITNFGKKRGMHLKELAIVNPHGEIRPYFISIEEKQS